MRVAFSGPAQVGKTTCAEYLAREHKGVVLSFASRLKKDAHAYGWDGDKDVKGRVFLQELGRVVREYNEDYWLDSLVVQLYRLVHQYPAATHKALGKRRPPVPCFVDDVRYLNEAERLRELDFTLVRIQPGAGFITEGEDWRVHPSEVDLDGYAFDHYITSDKGDIAGMLNQLEGLDAKEV